MKKIVLVLLVLGVTACKRQFEPINYGHEACAYCKMTIMDKRFAAEILTSKGRAIKFDDLGCLLKYIKEAYVADDNARIFVADYNNPNDEFLDAHKAIYIQSDQLKSPMGGNYASLSTMALAKKMNTTLNSTLLDWNNLK